jgi:hypothetical protein
VTPTEIARDLVKFAHGFIPKHERSIEYLSLAHCGSRRNTGMRYALRRAFRARRELGQCAVCKFDQSAHKSRAVRSSPTRLQPTWNRALRTPTDTLGSDLISARHQGEMGITGGRIHLSEVRWQNQSAQGSALRVSDPGNFTSAPLGQSAPNDAIGR